MKRQLIALLGAIAVLLAIGSGAAQAQSVQGVEQSAGTGQSANSSASSTQTNPSNSNISVRIFSPGDNGTVSQSNNSVAGSAAGNAASTTQGVSQAQGGGGGEQAVGQVAETIQKAKSKAESKQEKPSNSNISVRIHSEGDDGDVEQSNNSIAGSAAGNLAETSQGVEQEQGGGEAAKWQVLRRRLRRPGRRPGGQDDPDGRVRRQVGPGAREQREHPGAHRLRGRQRLREPVEQLGRPVVRRQRGEDHAGRRASPRAAAAAATATSCRPSVRVPSRASSPTPRRPRSRRAPRTATRPSAIHSEGDDGDVEQSNNSIGLSAALNAAKTEQAVGQSQGGGCGCGDRHKSDGARVQAVGQWAETWQKADSDAKSEQWKPSNTNAPVREKSKGGGGSVSQSNNSLAASLALNLAATLQAVRQEQ